MLCSFTVLFGKLYKLAVNIYRPCGLHRNTNNIDSNGKAMKYFDLFVIDGLKKSPLVISYYLAIAHVL